MLVASVFIQRQHDDDCASSSPHITGAFRRATLIVDCSMCSDLLCGMAKSNPNPVENTASRAHNRLPACADSGIARRAKRLSVMPFMSLFLLFQSLSREIQRGVTSGVSC